MAGVAGVRMAVAGVVVAGSAEVWRPPGQVSSSAALQAVTAPPRPHLYGGGAVPGLGRGRHALQLHSLQLHLLLVFHPPVLEPDLDLSLRQTQHARHLNSPEIKMLTEMCARLGLARHYLGNYFLMELVSGRGMRGLG